jgi:hypothetical protein
MRLDKIRGRLPLQRSTGSKYRISVLLSFESEGERETFFRKAGIPLDTAGIRVLSAMYLDLDDKLMQEAYVSLQWREDGKLREVEVPTTKRWKGAVEATRAYLELRKTIYGY